MTRSGRQDLTEAISLKSADRLGVFRNHFHSEHQGQQAKFDLDGKLIAGNIQSRTALRLIRQWTSVHRRELEANWKRLKGGVPWRESRPCLEVLP